MIPSEAKAATVFTRLLNGELKTNLSQVTKFLDDRRSKDKKELFIK